MKKLAVFCLVIICSELCVFAQNTSVTNNNTVTINGNVYYFQPSSIPSSPPPSIKGSDFISAGDWYGENAARAWASIVDWIIEHSFDSTKPVRVGFYGSGGSIEARDKIYISAVHAYHVQKKQLRFTAGRKRFYQVFKCKI